MPLDTLAHASPVDILDGTAIDIVVVPGLTPRHEWSAWVPASGRGPGAQTLPLGLFQQVQAIARGQTSADAALRHITPAGRQAIAGFDAREGRGAHGPLFRVANWAAEARHHAERWGTRRFVVPDVSTPEEAAAFATLGATVVGWHDDPHHLVPSPTAAPHAPDPHIVLVGGGSGTGKDYLTDHYVRPNGFRALGLSDRLKHDAIARGEATYDEAIYTRPPRVRALLQDKGSRQSRALYGDDYWCDIWMLRAEWYQANSGHHQWYVPDNRFPNELAFFQRRGSLNLRIHAPERYAHNSMTAEARTHISERALDGCDHLYTMIDNDPKDRDTVGPILLRALTDHTWTVSPTNAPSHAPSDPHTPPHAHPPLSRR